MRRCYSVSRHQGGVRVVSYNSEAISVAAAAVVVVGDTDVAVLGFN